nr:hypothetical protein [Tanacetum cinerariifolium]
MPKVLSRSWEKFFEIQHAQSEDTSELFQKLLEDLQIINKELAEYINSPSWNRPTFYNNDEEHSIKYNEYLENSSNTISTTNFNQEKEEPPQNFDIRQFIREVCGIEVCEEQKQNMEDTMLELLEVCRQKELYCVHNNVDDLIESALNSKLLSINLKSQQSFQNFRVIHKKSSISLNNTSQISPVNAITTVSPTKEPEYSLSMGYEHLSTILETESDKVIKSSVKNLVQIPSEYEVTSDNESDDDELLSTEDVPMENFKIYSNPLFNDEEINSNKIDPHYFSAESDLIESLSNRDTLFDSSPMFDYFEEFFGELMPTSIINEERIKREHKEYISLMEKLLTINLFPRPLENFHVNTIIKTLPTSPIPVEDSDSLREEIDIFTGTDDFMPPGIESDDYDSERDIHFLEELLIDDAISLPENESSNFDHYDDPLFSRPPSEPPDVEVFFDFEPKSGELISSVMNNIDELNKDECFGRWGCEIDVFANVKDDDYFPFIFVIRIFLPYLIYPKVSPLLFSTGSEDTIFDLGISI